MLSLTEKIVAEDHITCLMITHNIPSALSLGNRTIMMREGRIALERVFTSEQIAAYEKAPAWFFNTWKTSGLLPGWDARVAMATFERGMIA